MTVERRALDDAILAINRLMRSHGGAIELVDVSESGAVSVRFAGMCCGCPWKPITWFGTVERALLAVPGVTTAEAAGTRISAEAEARIRSTVG